MADFNEAFNGEFGNVVNYNQEIDYFFTQRKIIEYDEYIDKNMNRKKKKKSITYNFIAINLPYYSSTESNNVSAEIKIWGDDNFKYSGKMQSYEGIVPNILLKLEKDKRLFINIKILENESDNDKNKDYVTFINIPKRYQVQPNNTENSTENSIEDSTENLNI